MKQKEIKTFRNKVLEDWNNGNLVFVDMEGLKSVKFEDFIKQPLNGMLYDINRNAATILTLINDPKWVNDFALTKLLEYYYNKCKEYEEKKYVNNEGT